MMVCANINIKIYFSMILCILKMCNGVMIDLKGWIREIKEEMKE
jgi:hypothetical protein